MMMEMCESEDPQSAEPILTAADNCCYHNNHQVETPGEANLQTLNTWLDCPECQTENTHNHHHRAMRDSRHLLTKYFIQHVTGSHVTGSHLLYSTYCSANNMLTICSIGSSSDTFHNVQSPAHTFQFLAATDKYFLAYSHYYRLSSNTHKAAIFMFNRRSVDHEVVASWDLNMDWTYRAISERQVVPNVHSRLGCSVHPGGDLVLVLGPTERFRRHGHSWGCKVLDLNRKQFIKDIHIAGYSWGAAGTFNPRPDRSHLVSLVCCRRFEFCSDFSRPNTTGVLLNYDLHTDKVTAVLGGGEGSNSDPSVQWCSSEMLNFSPDGDFLFIRRGTKIHMVDALSLIYLRGFESDMTQLRQEHFSLRLFYKFFPTVSPCSCYFITLCGREGLSLDERVTPCVIKYALPRFGRYLSLRKVCRQMIRSRVIKGSDVEQLPLPTRLKQYLQYR